MKCFEHATFTKLSRGICLTLTIRITDYKLNIYFGKFGFVTSSILTFFTQICFFMSQTFMQALPNVKDQFIRLKVQIFKIIKFDFQALQNVCFCGFTQHNLEMAKTSKHGNNKVHCGRLISFKLQAFPLIFMDLKLLQLIAMFHLHRIHLFTDQVKPATNTFVIH